MILIADSGSTKTEWVVIDGKEIYRFFTVGFNPFFVSSQEISDELRKKWPSKIDKNEIYEIYFYGAGCSSEQRCQIVYHGLKTVFPQTRIQVSHDIEAAATGLWGDAAGIAIILGTGSNSCIYDGRKIVENIPALGYILGDEGSGAYFGLQLVKDFLNKEMPENLYKKFQNQFPYNREYILDRVYKKPLPNRFLAGFAPFLTENISEVYIENMVAEGFDLFFKRHVLPYKNYRHYQIGSVGSIGYFLADMLRKTAQKYGYSEIKIMKSPLDGLIEYYQKK